MSQLGRMLYTQKVKRLEKLPAQSNDLQQDICTIDSSSRILKYNRQYKFI